MTFYRAVIIVNKSMVASRVIVDENLNRWRSTAVKLNWPGTKRIGLQCTWSASGKRRVLRLDLKMQ